MTLEKLPIDRVLPYIAVRQKYQTLVADLVVFLKGASAAVAKREVEIDADVWQIKMFVESLEAQATIQFRLCMRWSWQVYLENGICTLEITVDEYEFATPVGYSLQ